MSKKNDAWGIEVGSYAIKALHLIRTPEGVEVADYTVFPFKQPLTTPDLDVDETIQVRLEAFLAKYDVSRSTVTVSVPGHMAFAKFAKLPPVDPKKIPDIVKFEAVQQIPFPLDQMVFPPGPRRSQRRHHRYKSGPFRSPREKARNPVPRPGIHRDRSPFSWLPRS